MSFFPRLNAYQSESRNLYAVQNPNRRTKLLRTGKLSIVSFLNELPKSEHDLNSFTLDIPFATDRLMTFTVSGVFRERLDRKPIRAFNRMFVVVPQGSGFVIVNEMFFVTVPTHLQVKAAFTGSSPVAAQAAAAAASPAPGAAAVPTSPAGAPVDVSVMQQKIPLLAAKTNMNDNWSKM